MELRKINTSDIFALIGIIRKLGVDEIKKHLLILGNTKGKNARETGTETILSLICLAIEKLPEIADDLCGFIGGICGKTADEIKALPPAETVELIEKITAKEEFGDFFTAVSRSFTAKKNH